MALTNQLERYRTISKLGSGGMATVTLAEDQVLGRQVALKRMTVSGDVRGLSRLRREALIGASLSHPNLVSIYDIIAPEDGEHIIVMEYVEGETLSARLEREDRLPISEALRVLGAVAIALDAIHAQGIVHRDVKPANILLGSDGSVKLADLGIAAVSDRTRITTTGAILGSFRYMAPEQLENDNSTPAIDIYALSAVAFEVLSGRKARRETNPLALAHAIATQPAPDLRDAWPHAPAAAADVIRRGMSRDLSRRPASATELTGRLRAALLPENTVQFRAPVPVVPGPAPAALAAPAVLSGAVGAAATRRPAPPPTARVSLPPPRFPRAARPPANDPAPFRRGLLAAALLGLAAAAVVLAVILGGGGSSPKPTKTASTAHRSRSTSKASHGRSKTTGAGPSVAASDGTAAAGTSTSPGAGTTAAPSGTPGSSTTAASGALVTPAPSSAAAGSPVSSVESFYGLAASHRYPEAWTLADSAFRAQLAGYQSFQSGQAGDRSITFNSANVTSQSDTAATVAVTTTSVRTDGTKHCAGAVDLLRASSSAPWLLHQIHINCS